MGSDQIFVRTEPTEYTRVLTFYKARTTSDKDEEELPFEENNQREM